MTKAATPSVTASLLRNSWYVSFIGYGCRIGVQANSDEALSAVIKELPPGLKRRDVAELDVLYSVVANDTYQRNGSPRDSVVSINGQELARANDFTGIPVAVERHLSIYLAEFARNRVFVHAGVVGWNGKAVLMPGKSRSGKSTLVTALLRAGATYYSDEFAVVDATGRVHPYLSPIQLRNGDGTHHRIQPAELLGGVGRKPLPVGLVLVTRHRRDVAWRPRRLSVGEGMLELLTNTVSAQHDPARALRTLTLMLAGVQILKGPRGEADAMVARLLRGGHLLG